MADIMPDVKSHAVIVIVCNGREMFEGRATAYAIFNPRNPGVHDHLCSLLQNKYYTLNNSRNIDTNEYVNFEDDADDLLADYPCFLAFRGVVDNCLIDEGIECLLKLSSPDNLWNFGLVYEWNHMSTLPTAEELAWVDLAIGYNPTEEATNIEFDEVENSSLLFARDDYWNKLFSGN